VRREEVVIVSKVGYLQGEDLTRLLERERSGRPLPEVVTLGEGLRYGIHPEVLRDGLERSLERLGLETLDVLLLHDPEELLGEARRRGVDPDAARADLNRQLRESFAFLEERAEEGTIRWYGVSSNTVAAEPSDPEATSLRRMLEAARGAGGESHRFRVLQLPFNLFESAAALAPVDERLTLLELAEREGVGVLANRPLNAMSGGRVVRLADVPGPLGGEPGADGDVDARALAELEGEFRREIAPAVRVTRGSVAPSELFRWAERIAALSARVESLERWNQLEQEAILPQVGHVVAALDRGLSGVAAERWEPWRDRYLTALDELLAAGRAAAAERSRAALGRIESVLDPLLPEERRGEPLARKALWVAAGVPGVSAVLNGMRRPGYVRDAVEVLSWPLPPRPRDVLEGLARAEPTGGNATGPGARTEGSP
jgi:hypothetical protein